MKLSIIALLVSFNLSAVAAEKAFMDCVVPTDSGAAVTVKGTISNESAVDFIRLTVVDGQTTQFFSQVESGQVDSQIKSGSLTLLLVSDSSRQENGVIRNAGFMGLGKKDGNKFSGLMSAQSHIYPLECTFAQ